MSSFEDEFGIGPLAMAICGALVVGIVAIILASTRMPIVECKHAVEIVTDKERNVVESIRCDGVYLVKDSRLLPP